MTDPVVNPYANPAPLVTPLAPAEEKQWAILTHVIGIFFGAISAIVLYVIYRDRGPYIRTHVTTELNFQITLFIAQAIGFLLAFGSIFVSIAASVGTQGEAAGATPPGIGLFFLGYVLILVIRLIALIYGIVAAVAANRGTFYRYPLAIRFLK